jgi:hypothetical protein
MFEIVTRAKANPAKRELLVIPSRTRGKTLRVHLEGTLYCRATTSSKLWILLIEQNIASVYHDVVELQKRKLQTVTRNHVETS